MPENSWNPEPVTPPSTTSSPQPEEKVNSPAELAGEAETGSLAASSSPVGLGAAATLPEEAPGEAGPDGNCLPPPVGKPEPQSVWVEPPAVAQAPQAQAADHSTFWSEAGSFMRDLTFSILVAILVIVFVVQPVRVEGTSMLPRLHDGERIFVNKFVYRFERIDRGDIVVFWWPNDPSKSFIKRVIGLPGETVSVRDGAVYIDGEPYDEPYLDGKYHRRHDHMQPVFVKEHHFFVMGDNRDSSNDSRVWGLVPEKYIYGKAMFRYWPLSGFGTVR